MKIEPSEKPFDDDEDIGDDVGEGDSGGSNVKIYRVQDFSQNETENYAASEEDSDGLSAEVTVPDFSGRSIRESSRLANSSGLSLETDGSGRAVEQSINAGATVKRGTTIKVNFSQD